MKVRRRAPLNSRTPTIPSATGTSGSISLSQPREHFHLPTFLLRSWSSRRTDFAFADAQSIPLLLPWMETVTTSCLLLCGKQVSFPFNSTFKLAFLRSFTEIATSLLARAKLSREKDNRVFRMYLYDKPIDRR